MNNTILVNHTTKVILPFFNHVAKEISTLAQLQKFLRKQEQHFAIISEMVAFLNKRNFEFEYFSDKIIAYSSTVEAFAIKQDLLDAGFSNHDFQIHLDYVRKWGIL